MLFAPRTQDSPLDAVPTTRPRGLVVPFAVVGASAGFFSVLALGAAFEGMRQVSPLLAAAFALAAGGAAGFVIERWRRLHHPFRAVDSMRIYVGAIVVVAGTAAGAALGYAAWDEWGVPVCAAGGGGCALAFVPCALFVVDAAKRAARARFGSLVAGVDRRTVLASLAAACAFATSVQAPALFAGTWSERVPAHVQGGASVAVGLACVVALAALRARDVRTEAELDAAERDAAGLTAATAATEEDRAALDLGLGGERWAQTWGVPTYRTTERSSVVLRGSLAEARRAVSQALAHRRATTWFAAAVVVATTVSFAVGLVRAF
jgi:hypothetical protein